MNYARMCTHDSTYPKEDYSEELEWTILAEKIM
jgi:hypothetical protein